MQQTNENSTAEGQSARPALLSSERFRATAIFGSSELKTFFREENGWLVFYGYRIDYDQNGVETSRTEPTATGRMTVGNTIEPKRGLFSRLFGR